MWHYGVTARLGGSDRPDEWRPIKESHGRTEAEAGAAFAAYLESLAVTNARAAKRLERDARAEPCRCHWQHVPSFSNAAERLRSAMDRQGRADTSESWLADQAAIDRAMAELAELGADPERIESDIAAKLARRPA